MFRFSDELRNKLTWAIVLIPGFLAVAIASLLSNREVASDFEYLYFSLFWSLAIAFVAGVAIVVIFFFVFRIIIGRAVLFLPLAKDSHYSELDRLLSDEEQRAGPSLSAMSTARDLLFGALVLAFSLVLGVGLAYVYSTDFLFYQLRNTNIEHPVVSLRRPVAFLLESNRRDELNILGDGRDKKDREQRSYVEIVAKGGAKFAGMPELYPSGNSRTEIHLSPACVYDSDSKCWRANRGAGVTIYEDQISHILWTDDEGSACFALWEPCAYCDDPTTLPICDQGEVARPASATQR